MALPTISLPTFTTIIPSTGESISYRPFVVKEQRNLMVAIDADAPEIYRVMRECVRDCTFGKVNLEGMPNFDLEYIFMQIRVRSIGEMLPVDITCPHCGYIDTKDLDLSKATVVNLEKKKSDIRLSDKLGLTMRYPTLEEIGLIENSPDSETVFSVIRNCVQTIYTDLEVNTRDSFTDQELREWLENMTDDQFREIENFVIDSPYLYSELLNTCKKCEKDTMFKLRGIKSFFV